jgi:uncharacterized protein YbjT (DUF2867 family)
MRALILGGTGLVGNQLVQLLVSDKRFESVELLTRREIDQRDIKVITHVVDFSSLNELQLNSKVDVLFIAFGTTIKKAGSQAKQVEIDVDIPSRVMELAKKNGVEKCVLVSSLGVSSKSPFFYSRMKAQLDENARKIGFEKLILIKPSMLTGNRTEKRFGEKLSITIGNTIGMTGLINSYRPVEAINVAKCMIQCVIELPNGIHEISSNEIVEIAKKYSLVDSGK